MFECTSRTLDFLPAASRTLHRMEKDNIEINQRRRWLRTGFFEYGHQRSYRNTNRRPTVNSITINTEKMLNERLATRPRSL